MVESDCKPFSVVIVDADPLIGRLLQELVGGLPGTVTQWFGDPHEALAWCTAHEVDLIVTDLQLPGMHGTELIMELRRQTPLAEVPMLLITALEGPEVRIRALEHGATDFLGKPIDPTEVRTRCRNMLALRRTQRAQLEHAASLDGEVRRVTQRIADREQETIVRLSRAAEQRDWGDSLHVVRVAGYARIMASRLGLTRDAEEAIRRMAPLHDIGKLGIPDHILRKPDRLDEGDFAVVKQHTSIGYRILSGSESDLLSLGADIALTHHERFDGSGYPGGLCGEDIPLAGRIVAVADSFDALTSDRPYKDKWPAELAWLHLRKHSGSWFDPPCVEAFSQGMEEVEEVMTSSADRALGPGGARTAVSR